MEKIAKNLQLVLMVIILISTVIAVGIEMNKMFLAKSVTLADLLLMFLYLEVLAMVRIFWDQQSISITSSFEALIRGSSIAKGHSKVLKQSALSYL